MAWNVSPEMRAAIDSYDREVQWRLVMSYNDVQLVVPSRDLGSVSIDRQPEAAADNIALFAGSIAAEAHWTIVSTDPLGTPDGDAGYAYGPYGKWWWSNWRDQTHYGMRAHATLDQGFLTETGYEWITVFQGYVEQIAILDDGSASMTARDYGSALLTDASLPMAAVEDGSPDLPLYACVEHLLRRGEFYRTPPPLDHCVLSVPSLLPEIGDVADPLKTEPNPAPNLGRYAAPSYYNRYTATETYAPTPDKLTVIEGWFRSASSGALRELVRVGVVPGTYPGAGDGLGLYTTAAGAIRATTADGVGVQTADGLWPNDNAWHYLYVHVVYRTDESYLYVDIDGTAVSSGWQPVVLIRPDNLSYVVRIGGLVHEGVSVRYPPLAGYETVRRSDWQPNYAIDLRGDSPGIRAIPRGVTGSAWQAIKDIASATGAVFRWREDGAWRWQERDSFHDRRFDESPVKNVYETHWLMSSGYSYDVASMRSSVTIDHTNAALVRSTASNPAWKADEPLIVDANSVGVFEFDTDPIIGIQWPQRTSVTSAERSAFQVVPAHQVGDPSASPIGGVDVFISPTATGIRVRIRNGNSQPVATWDPTSGQPLLHVQGWTVITQQQTYTAKASDVPLAEGYEMPASPWRQDRVFAQGFALAVAAQVALPAMIFADQQMVGDPTLTVDDTVRIRTPDMAGGVVCQVIGMSYSDHENVLTVRPIYRPTGWVLDVQGRSELDSTTKLVV